MVNYAGNISPEMKKLVGKLYPKQATVTNVFIDEEDNIRVELVYPKPGKERN